VLDDNGEGNEEDVALAIDEAISLFDEGSEFAPHIIKLSLGSVDDGNPNNPMRVACRAAIAKNICVFAACGNSGPYPQTITCPACERYVGALGSLKYEPFVVSEFSSRGPTVENVIKPDGAVFGEDLSIASSENDTAVHAVSGTSFSAAFVSGMGVITREGMIRQAVFTFPTPGIDPEKMGWQMSEEELIDRFLPVICIKPEGVAAAKDNVYGYGLPFGPNIRRIIQPIGIDAPSMMSGMIGLMMMVMMMGMMKGVMTTNEAR